MIASLNKLRDFEDSSREALIPTRASLLSRIRDLSAEDSWREFFEIYWKLIYNTARRQQLTDAEAQEVVQETMVSLTQHAPTFEYNPARSSFKSWMMQMILWRVQDQVRKRRADEDLSVALEIPEEEDLAEFWDEDWEKNLISAALERVKNRVRPQTYQIFSFCVLRQKGITETARVLNISKARVYLARHRISRAITRELKALQAQPRITI
jgi:RNA polymerase sigma factor (sigma-70 family)